MKLTIIGDVHGKLEQYKQITDNCDFSICVGDFGFKKEWDWHKINVWQDGNFPHWINMGNHDYIPYNYDEHLKFATSGNFNYFTDYQLLTIRGADSIDKHIRTAGRDWFPNEELNYEEQLQAYDAYISCKPKIVVSHDCPQSICTTLFGYTDKSQTRVMLQHMFEEHKPELWIFGHYHRSITKDILGTKFICLNELETFEIDGLINQ